MNKINKKKWLNYILSPLLLCLLLYLIYRQLQQQQNLQQEWKQFLQHLQFRQSFTLAIVILLAPINWSIESLKWKVLLQKIEPIPFRKAFASVLTGLAFAIVTPSKIGDFAGRILYLSNQKKLKGAIAALIGNVTQTIVALFIGTIGLIYMNFAYPALWLQITLLLSLIGIGLLIYIYFHLPQFYRWTQKYPKLRPLLVAMRVFNNYSKKELLKIFFIAFLRFVVYNFQFLLLAQILGADLPWFGGFFLSAFMFWMISVIPSYFVADIGVRGFVAGLIFIQTGIAANSISLLASSYGVWILNLLVPAIIGSIFILFIKILK